MCALQKLIFAISKIIKITIVICKINKKRKLQITKTGKKTHREHNLPLHQLKLRISGCFESTHMKTKMLISLIQFKS